MPNRNSRPRGAFGRPRIPAPPSQIRRRSPPGRLDAIKQRVVTPARRRLIKVLLLTAGIAAGIAMAATALSLSDSLWTGDPEGRTAAPALPDYAATIRAPTPTPGGQPAPSTDVPLGPDDIAEFTLHTFTRALQEATAIAAGLDVETLMFIAAEPPAVAACIESLAETLADETLLPPTPPHAEETAGCFIEAMSAQRGAPHPHAESDIETREHRATAFLHRYGASADPITRAAAALPSPANMAMWRDTREERRQCYEAIPESARAIALIDDPDMAGEALGVEAQALQQCLAEAATPRHQSPTGP